MAFSVIFLSGVLILLLINQIVKQWRLRAQLPPGPVPWPIVGNIPTLLWPSERPVYEKFTELSKQYGEAMTLWYGTQPMVLLNSLDAIRAAVIDNQHDFASRPSDFLTEMFTEYSIVVSKYNAEWQKNKKLANRAMRSIVGSKQLEDHVVGVCNEAIEELLENSGPVKLSKTISSTVFSLLYYFCYGKHLPFSSPEFAKRLQLAEELNKIFDATFVANALPARQWLPWKYVIPLIKQVSDVFEMFREQNRNYFNEHIQSLNADHVRDVLDALVVQRNAMQVEGETVSFTDHHAAAIIMDIVLPGTETTRRTLSWFFLFMITNPDIQEQLAQQINSVLGDRTPSLADRPNLPLIEAALLETLRIRSIVPFGVPHAPSKDGALLLGKYCIPENTQVILNQHALHMDPKHWRNPEVFDPNHFLDTDGVVIKPPAFQPFGVGRRVCMGETLAKNDMFLIIANLMQKLRFKAVPGRKYSVEPSPAGRFFPVEELYEVLVERRG